MLEIWLTLFKVKKVSSYFCSLVKITNPKSNKESPVSFDFYFLRNMI